MSRARLGGFSDSSWQRSRPEAALAVRSRIAPDAFDMPGRSVAGMETWDAIRARRNVRRYTDQPIDDAGVSAAPLPHLQILGGRRARGRNDGGHQKAERRAEQIPLVLHLIPPTRPVRQLFFPEPRPASHSEKLSPRRYLTTPWHTSRHSSPSHFAESINSP